MKAVFRHVLPKNLGRAASLSAWVSPRPEGSETPGEQQGDQPCLARQWGNRRWPCLLATALVSATVLLVEVALTRVFSLFLHYHYVFIVLAIALLGLGLGATFWATAGRRWLQHSLRSPTGPLWQVCVGTGVTLIVMTVLLTQTALASVLPAAAALALLPFLGAGLFLALVFTAEAAHSRELYAADLIGAGLGCLASLPMLHWLGAEHTLALAALNFLGLAALLALVAEPRRWLAPLLVCCLFGSLLGLGMIFGTLAISPTAFMYSRKHLGQILRTDPSAHIVDSRWSALARTDVVAFTRQGERRYAAFTDGGAATLLVSLPATRGEWERVDREVGLFPYRTSPPERVLIIGSGGGLDVLLALRGGAQAITAVEVNPEILRAVEHFIPPARNVYRLPQVRVVRGDGRHVVRQSTQRYDLIVLQQVYTGAAQQQGGTLVENYVLTSEAFQDYLAHLTPQGRLVVQVHDVTEALKTVFMSVTALAHRGVTRSDALQHLLILQETPATPDTAIPVHAPLIVLKNTPYTPAESHQQAAQAWDMHFTTLFVPHYAAASPLADLLQSAVEISSHSSALGTTLRPATDNRPFFYETDTALEPLSWVVLTTLCLVLGLLLWHSVRQRRHRATPGRSSSWLLFVAMTGCAALGIQVALLQRSMLVLGSPTLTLVALLFPLLFCGGIGSLASTVLSNRTLCKVLPWSCLALSALLGLHLIAFPGLQAWLAQQELLGRVLGTMMFLAPVGLLMGLPFPVTLRLLSPMAETIVPWVWGVNAVACVLGSVAAVRLAVSWGLQEVVILGALVYVLAGCWGHRLLGRQSQRAGIPT